MIESAALDERAQGENGLPATRPPSHAGAFEPFSDQSLARRLHDAGADGQSQGLGIGVAHAVAIATEVAQHLDDSLVARRLRAQIDQRRMTRLTPSGSWRNRWRYFLNCAAAVGESVPWAVSKASLRCSTAW